jgi:DNA polymerase III epsilon subunit-like protein
MENKEMKTDNIYIFLDTEFTNLSRNSKLISMGALVLSYKRESFYAEFNDYSDHLTSDFVKKEVIPNLIFNTRNEFIQEEEDRLLFMKSDSKVIKSRFIKWLRHLHNTYGKNITFVVDVGTYDWFLLSELIREEDVYVNTGNNILPEYVNYIPIDVSTMLYLSGFDMDVNRDEFLGLTKDENTSHNALKDAKKTHMIYAMLMNRFFADKDKGGK